MRRMELVPLHALSPRERLIEKVTNYRRFGRPDRAPYSRGPIVYSDRRWATSFATLDEIQQPTEEDRT